MFTLALIAAPIIGFTKPQPWLTGFCSANQPAFLQDIDADGMADLVRVNLGKDAFVDVAKTVEGQKCGEAIRSLDFPKREILCITVAPIDKAPGADVIALDSEGTVWLASGQKDCRFSSPKKFSSIAKQLKNPAMCALTDGSIWVWSMDSGAGYSLPSQNALRLPRGTRWVGESNAVLYVQSKSLEVRTLDPKTFRTGKVLAVGPVAAGQDLVIVDGYSLTGGVRLTSLKTPIPVAPTRYLVGDVDGNGAPDVIALRNGSEKHTGNQVFVWRGVGENGRDPDQDPDHDGLTNAEELALGTDPLDPDTDGDGLLDGWEVKGYRGLDLKALDCDPRHADAICLVSKFPGVNQAHFDKDLQRVKDFYSGLKMPNPDHLNGLAFHAILLDQVPASEISNPWWVNREKFRQAKWRGVAHWMQVTPGGGGQADELGDGGTCGEGALWAVFVHEFGHQMGLNHEGFWPNNLCPTYPSLMNYAYSYGFEDDINKIHYSDGALANFVLNEADLDETIPLKYEQVKFLEKGPYRFHLKPAGNNTLIDWNWNGIFGEKHVRADINYSYSTNAGLRDTVGKTTSAPWVFTHKGLAYILYVDNSKLLLKKLIKPTVWAEPVVVDDGGCTGDPVGISYKGKVKVFYQSKQGVVVREVDEKKVSQPLVVATDPSLVPTTGEYRGYLFVFLWNPMDGTISYSVPEKTGFTSPRVFDFKSTNPIGIATDSMTGQMIMGLAQNQTAAKTNRWQIRKFEFKGNSFLQRSQEWVEGENGGSRGSGRITVLFDRSKDAGPAGRIYFYCLGLTSKQAPWSCVYMAHQVADKSMNNGWMVKRYYDEWTQSRSAPGVCWFNGDFLYAYRWVDGGGGATDNNLHVGYRGQGIQNEPMADFDDIGFVRNFGLPNSILILNNR